MNAYIYQAALLCEDCAMKARDSLQDSGQVRHPSFIVDSDHWPQGPYPDGGGESDSPQHCDHCGLFLENPLTCDGESYVKSFNPSIHWGTLPDAWREFYAYLWDTQGTEDADEQSETHLFRGED